MNVRDQAFPSALFRPHQKWRIYIGARLKLTSSPLSRFPIGVYSTINQMPSILIDGHGDANLLAQVRSPLLPILLPFLVLLQSLLLAAEVFVIAVLDHCCVERLCFVHRRGCLDQERMKGREEGHEGFCLGSGDGGMASGLR
jgi:hypothetical protein